MDPENDNIKAFLGELNRQMNDLQNMDVTENLESSDDEDPPGLVDFIPVSEPGAITRPKSRSPRSGSRRPTHADDITYVLTEKGSKYFDLLGEKHFDTADGKMFRLSMTERKWQMEQLLVLSKSPTPSSWDDYYNTLVHSVFNSGTEIHRNMLFSLSSLLTEAVHNGLLKAVVNCATVTIPRSEYEELQKAKRHLSLLSDANSDREYALQIRECSHPKCQAVSIHDGGRSPDICHGCESMICCDDQSVCRCEGLDPYYCDKHVSLYIILNPDEINICYPCHAYHESFKLKDKPAPVLNDGLDKRQGTTASPTIELPERDIALVMKQCSCSREKAIFHLTMQLGDIVMAIMNMETE